jgi:hypothetical protein
LKSIIAEIDRLAKHVESFDEPWAFNIVWRLDRIAQQLQEKNEKNSKTASDDKLSKISKNILDQYMDDISFLSENEHKLTDLIRNQETKNASAVYSALKKHFGKLDRKDSINFIKNILKKQK